MAITNTHILIKRSSTASLPTGLQTGELAYSYLSNTMFIGDGTASLNVGGVFYTQQIDNATASNIINTIVKRSSNGSFSGTLTGNATTATTLQTPRNFSISGGDVAANAIAFDGSAPVALNASLTTVPGLTAGTYGSSTASVVLTVGANGRVLAITTAPIASGGAGTGDFTISDGTTSNTIFYANGAILYFKGANGITSTVSPNTVTYSTDNTVVRSNTSSVGTQVINTDLEITGNLVVFGSQTSINISGTVIQTGDTLLELAANNTLTDLLDIGFYGKANVAGTIEYVGLIREGTDRPSAGYWYLYNGLVQPVGNNITYTAANTGTLVASLTGGSIHGLANSIGVIDGGTGVKTLSAGEMVVGNGTSPIVSLANVAALSLTITGNNTVSNVQTDTYGRVISFQTQPISGLSVSQGGTGLATITQDGIIFGNGTNAVGATAAAGSADQTWSNQILTVTNAGVPVWSTNLDGGTF